MDYQKDFQCKVICKHSFSTPVTGSTNRKEIMKVIYNIFLYFLYFVLVKAFYITDYNKDIVRFVISVQEQYQSDSVIVAMNGINNDLSYKSAVSIKLTKYFSRKNVSSMFTTVEDLPESIEYYEKFHEDPLYVIFFESYNDFECLIDVSKNVGVKLLTSLLIFKSSDRNLINICKNPKQNYFNLDFDSSTLVVCLNEHIPIREWYSIFPDQIETYNYATWNYVEGLHLLGSKYIYDRRKSLKGIDLRVSYIKEETELKNGILEGYFGELIRIMSEFANFTIQFQEPEEAYGVYNDITKQWNGLIGQLAINKTDIGLAEFTMTSKRLSAVDFSIPLKSSPCCFFVKKLDYVLQQSIYYKCVGKRAAFSLISIHFLAPFLITYMLYQHNKAHYHIRGTWRIVQTLKESFISVWGIFCKMPLPKMTKISSLRIAYLSLFVLSFMLSSIYSAILTSYLTNLKYNLPLNSIEDFIEDDSYKLITVNDSSLLEQITDSKDKTFEKLRNRLLDTKYLPTSELVAMQAICNEKLALFNDQYCQNPKDASSTCELVPFAHGHLTSISIAYVKNSPYLKFFNFILQKLRRSGLLKAMNDRDLSKDTPKPYHYHHISFQSAQLLFIILIIGTCLSIIVLMIEKIFFYFSPTPQHDFAISRTNYWTPLIRPPKKNKKQRK